MVDDQEEIVGICFKVVIYICTVVKLLNLRRPLGAKVWDWDIFLQCKRMWLRPKAMSILFYDNMT